MMISRVLYCAKLYCEVLESWTKAADLLCAVQPADGTSACVCKDPVGLLVGSMVTS